MSTWRNKEYKSLALESVRKYGKELLKAEPKDGKEYSIDRFPDRSIFWAELLGAMAKFESNQNPKLVYKEDFDDSNGEPVQSRGLLQISFESANGYGAKLKKPEELHDPMTNLRVGVLILSRWVPKDSLISGGKPGARKGGSRYWAVLRKPHRISAIQKMLKEVKA